MNAGPIPDDDDRELAEDRVLLARVRRSLTNISPAPDQIERIEELRLVAKDLATSIVELCPSSRERSLALTHLEETAMWAVKSIVLEAEE